ncbi:MAG: hypothetical protein GY943_39545 [Chloroflexi bacterium]|nr:hypothetical protein [Chloroflexota bacterium]
MARSSPPGDEPPGSFYKGLWPFLAQRASYLSLAVYRRTKTAVYALSLQLSSLGFRQKTLSLTRMG